MFVPDPVISLSLTPVGKESTNFSRALNRFKKEDPTFRVHLDAESKEVCFYLCSSLMIDSHVYDVDYYLRNGRVAS